MNRIGRFLRAVGTDIRYAVRMLRRNARFSLVVVLTLALGAGAATAVFSVVDAVLLRPLPYDQAHRLVELNVPDNPNGRIDPVQFEAWLEEGSAFADGWLAHAPVSQARVDGPAPELLNLRAVTSGADTLLGIPLLLGRGFTDEEARVGADVALMTESYWARTGRDPDILGSTIRLESGAVTVVGVVSGEMKFPVAGDTPALWLPIHGDWTAAGEPVTRLQGVWARIHEGLTRGQAQERADRIAAGLEESTPRDRAWAVELNPLDDFRANRGPRQALWILSATVGMILLVAFMNGANLFGIRAMARARELDIRAAVGASRWRILRQMLVESVLLGLIAGVAAFGLAWAAFRGMEGFIPRDIVYFSVNLLEIEGRTLAFAFAASLVGGTLLGLLPGLTVFRRGWRGRVGGWADDSPGQRRIRSALVVGQVALSTVLLVGAVLFATSFGQLIRTNPGFDYEHLVQGDIGPPQARYASGVERAALMATFEEALEADPSVDGVTFSTGTSLRFGVTLEAESGVVPADQPSIVPDGEVAVDYFEVTGTELVAGRPFRPGDADRNVAIVDRDLALFLWGTEDVVGRRFRMDEDEEWLEVVGVAGDLRLMGRDQSDGPYQLVRPRPPGGSYFYTVVHVRAAGDRDPGLLLPRIRTAMAAADPELAFFRLRTAAQALGESEETPRFLAALMTALGGIAVVLAGVGIFGVLGYSVRRREREMGVRAALGAGPGRIVRMVVGDGLLLGAAGVVLGIAGSLYLAGWARDLLFQVDPRDPTLLTVSALFFLAIVATASFLPAARAARVDPVDALRTE